MATEESTPVDNRSGREPLSPAKRKRLEKVFEHAVGRVESASSPSDFDYVAELLTQCVSGDPGNAYYVRALLENLQKKYKHNKKGAPLANLKVRGPRNAAKKAVAAEQWDEAVRQGLKALAINPWDMPTLIAMATAAQKSGDRDCEICYLKSALMGSPKDPAANRLFAIAMNDRGLIDQAITYWRRVEEASPGDEEARRAIASLTVQKARTSGKFDEEEDEISPKPKTEAKTQTQSTLEQRLKRKIQNEPEKIDHYLELAQFYLSKDRFEEAEKLFGKAYQLSDGDPDVREKWEDAQLRRLRQKIIQAKDPEEAKKLRRLYFQKDVEFCNKRVERYPGNLLFKYELGYRYMKTGQYAEAIRELQAAKNDPRRKGACLLVLGECFQQINQLSLALSHYQSAVEELPERDAENRKKALYLAGRLAMYLRDFSTAEKHLTTLASLDFTYKDVSKLLDKLAKIRENPESANTTDNENTEKDQEADESNT